MRCITFIFLLAAGYLATAFPALAAHDCPGNFSVMRGYRPGTGGVCAQMGLNTHAGTCLPGQPYEILCDDASGGRYKTCPGPRRCDGRGVPPGYQGGGQGFSPGYQGGGQGFSPGYQGDGRPSNAGPGNFGPAYDGSYGNPSRPSGWNNNRPQQPQVQQPPAQRPQVQQPSAPRPQQPQPGSPGFNCTSWDFNNNQPCPPGRVNRDCRNGCDSQ